MAVFLVCEYALDGRALDRLVVQRHALAVQVVYAVGSSGLGAIRRYIETRTAGDTAISVRDRDYDFTAAEAHATWANPAGREFVWRRHEIENYFLEPLAVLELFNEWRAIPTARWATNLPANEADVVALLQSLARPLLPEHVAGLARAEVLRATNALGSLKFTHPSVPSRPGSPVPGQPEWRAAVVAEAARLCGVGAALAALPDLQSAAIGSRYDTLFTQCGSGTFFATGDHLREMGGKELLGALAGHLRGLGAPGRLNRDTIADQLLTALDRVYQLNGIFQPDDFAELAAVLARY